MHIWMYPKWHEHTGIQAFRWHLKVVSDACDHKYNAILMQMHMCFQLCSKRPPSQRFNVPVIQQLNCFCQTTLPALKQKIISFQLLNTLYCLEHNDINALNVSFRCLSIIPLTLLLAHFSLRTKTVNCCFNELYWLESELTIYLLFKNNSTPVYNM